MVSIAWFLANGGTGKLCRIEMYASYLVQFTAFLSQWSQNTDMQKCIQNIVVSLLRPGYWHAWSNCSWWKSDWTGVPRWTAPISRTVAVHALPEYCRPFWTRSLYKYFLSQHLVLIGFHYSMFQKLYPFLQFLYFAAPCSKPDRTLLQASFSTKEKILILLM